MSESKSRKERILEDLKSGDYLSPMGAMKRYGCTRLAARIYDLRQDGWPIETEMSPAGYAVYSLPEDCKGGEE